MLSLSVLVHNLTLHTQELKPDWLELNELKQVGNSRTPSYYYEQTPIYQRSNFRLIACESTKSHENALAVLWLFVIKIEI
ncbi:hypothetical protein WA026_017620 [Henosepilachna vigintioctopunctata]|uniref:Uncharacterized protein n=1 Tax=Henosepilachna vigintioctopunctata TaxID=420089 RepID=A0AAW1V1S9_9CUCU